MPTTALTTQEVTIGPNKWVWTKDKDMNTIKVRTSEVLEQLHQNREKHKEEARSALKVWEKKAKKAYRKAAAKAETGDFVYFPLEKFPKPENYVKQYDFAIQKLTYEVREEIEISDQDFAAWVQDNWSWRGAFIAGTSLYNG